MLTRPLTTRDPLEKYVKLEHHQLPAFPFDLDSIKFRHRKILKGLDPRLQSKVAEQERVSDRCSSVNSEAYFGNSVQKKVTMQEIRGQKSLVQKIALIETMSKQIDKNEAS